MKREIISTDRRLISNQSTPSVQEALNPTHFVTMAKGGLMDFFSPEKS
jgi:hypothetical protein